MERDAPLLRAADDEAHFVDARLGRDPPSAAIGIAEGARQQRFRRRDLASFTRAPHGSAQVAQVRSSNAKATQGSANRFDTFPSSVSRGETALHTQFVP